MRKGPRVGSGRGRIIASMLRAAPPQFHPETFLSPEVHMALTVGGPLFGAGFEIIAKQGHVVSFLPDSRNEERQQAGDPPIYYWLPKEVRMAQKPNGDYKFAF